MELTHHADRNIAPGRKRCRSLDVPAMVGADMSSYPLAPGAPSTQETEELCLLCSPGRQPWPAPFSSGTAPRVSLTCTACCNGLHDPTVMFKHSNLTGTRAGGTIPTEVAAAAAAARAMVLRSHGGGGGGGRTAAGGRRQHRDAAAGGAGAHRHVV